MSHATEEAHVALNILSSLEDSFTSVAKGHQVWGYATGIQQSSCHETWLFVPKKILKEVEVAYINIIIMYILRARAMCERRKWL